MSGNFPQPSHQGAPRATDLSAEAQEVLGGLQSKLEESYFPSVTDYLQSHWKKLGDDAKEQVRNMVIGTVADMLKRGVFRDFEGIQELLALIGLERLEFPQSTLVILGYLDSVLHINHLTSIGRLRSAISSDERDLVGVREILRAVVPAELVTSDQFVQFVIDYRHLLIAMKNNGEEIGPSGRSIIDSVLGQVAALELGITCREVIAALSATTSL